MFTKFRMKEEKGFTLIELLIVVAIIGILAAIAIPQFGAYRKRGYNASAQSDLRTVRTTQEAMQADFQDYGTSQIASTATAGTAGVETTTYTLWLVGGKTSSSPQTISLSPNVRAGVKGNINTSGTANTTYNAATAHISGDIYYGSDADTTVLFRMQQSTGNLASTANKTLGVVPTATTSDNFTGVGTWTATQ